ncbi:MAG: bifunctional hydroxymethylpyrimidine kinase/phosphomethylpyrimidine kinase [Lachnospiraceae bacterium]|nr:bifunctional hydroxymethylpyrimidine kinase/phosphomethylpyrimidine kinase [Lachnospiraceae bacterium]
MKTVLSIAGSDSSGGAGIQADLKTMTMNGVFGMTAITALTAQNTTGVRSISEVSPQFLVDQLDAVFEDIFPDAVKIGMVSSSGLIEVIAQKLEYYGAKNIVVDPVMVATSGSKLLKDDAIETLTSKLVPLATLITPNIPEAEILGGRVVTEVSGMNAGKTDQSEATVMRAETKEVSEASGMNAGIISIKNPSEMEKAAETIAKKYGCAVLLKGGHSISDANDLLYKDGRIIWFKGKRIDNPNTHGTGCTLSSAIASNLAKGYDVVESVNRAKEYISGALAAMLDLGKGSGPMMHNFNLRGEFGEEK